MKRIFKLTALILATTIIVVSCRPKKFSDIGDVSSKTKGIQDNWILSHAYVVDEAFATPDKFDITDFYKTKALPSLKFTETGFTALTTGTVKNYFGTGTGTWSFDNTDFPKSLYINYSDNSKDTFLLGSTIRTTDLVLKLKKTYYFTKGTAKKIAYSYIWEFTRQN